jgi:hypothetical protein
MLLNIQMKMMEEARAGASFDPNAMAVVIYGRQRYPIRLLLFLHYSDRFRVLAEKKSSVTVQLSNASRQPSELMII